MNQRSTASEMDYKAQLADEQRHLDEQKEIFRREKEEFERTKKFELKRLEQEKHLFSMKWKILEEELERYAADKKKLEQQKAFFEHVNRFEEKIAHKRNNIINGEMFFTGVHSEIALKRRYKELIKIYHPDNLDGDTNTIQEINREYDDLKKKFG